MACCAAWEKLTARGYGCKPQIGDKGYIVGCDDWWEPRDGVPPMRLCPWCGAPKSFPEPEQPPDEPEQVVTNPVTVASLTEMLKDTP